MRFELFIAARYLRAKRRQAVIGVITAISVAGVAAGTIYLYFKDKDDLIGQLHEEIIREVAEHMFVGHDSCLTLAEQYRHICRNFWQFCLNQPEVLSCKAQFDHLPKDILQQQHQNAEEIFSPLHTLFEDGRRQGVIKPLSDEVLFCLGLEPLMGLGQKHHLGVETLDDATVDLIIDAAWEALTLSDARTILSG